MVVFGAFVIGALVIGIVLGIRDLWKWKRQEFMSRINEKF